MREEKRIVKNFYEGFGWEQTDAGIYKDTAAFVDVRPVMEPYHKRSMRRLARHFRKGGRLFLDAGCGALASEDYVSVGSGHEQRVCVDISLKALREARKTLGDGAWAVAADISALPFPDNTFDGVLCAHVLYHLPPEEQLPTMGELYRVLNQNGTGVLVFTWASCLFTRAAVRFNPRIILPRIPGLRCLWRALLKPKAGHVAPDAPALPPQPALYFQPQPYSWYRDSVAPTVPVSLSCWQAVSLPFSQAFVLDRFTGTFILLLVSWIERLFPALLGRIGAYPVFLLRK